MGCSTTPDFISEDNKNRLIKEKLTEMTPLVKSCLEQEGRQNIDKGVAKLNFMIEESGKVTSANAKVQSGRLNKNILSCVEKVALSLKFPPSIVGKIEVNQPFNFY